MPRSREEAKAHVKLLKMLSGFSPDDEPPAILPLDYPKAELRLYVTAKVERKSRLHSCQKEPWTVEWLEQHARPGDTVYDVGANVGAYTLVAAHLVGASGRVVAFEPGYASFAHLCDNIVLNRFAGVVTPVPLPLGDTSRLSHLAYNRLHPGQARHLGEDGTTNAAKGAAVYEQPVLQCALDDLVHSYGLPHPRLLKIDVDGAELNVLRGARNILKGPTLEHVLMEIDLENSDGVVGVLAEAGLHLRTRHQRQHEDGTLAGFWYGLFSR
ncbi:MAG TPA: FkbM family methyltransferase [Vicinamibacterales bacterium]